jgi:HEPN domain-containing protein
MREEARLWWEQAKHDLETADYLLEGQRLDAASFYFQQAVEKALKAFYIHGQREAPGPTHSLTKLARDCGLPGHFLAFLRRLTGEYYLSRYPDASEDLPFKAYDVEEIRDTARLSHEVLTWLEHRISKS